VKQACLQDIFIKIVNYRQVLPLFLIQAGLITAKTPFRNAG
jgi:hypothetical protein